MGRRPQHGRGSGRNSDTRVSRDGLAEPVRVPRAPRAEGTAAARCLLGEERRGGHGRGGTPSHSTARAAAAGREGAAPQPWPGHALGSLWPWGWHATVAEPPQGRVCPASSGTAARTADLRVRLSVGDAPGGPRFAREEPAAGQVSGARARAAGSPATPRPPSAGFSPTCELCLRSVYDCNVVHFHLRIKISSLCFVSSEFRNVHLHGTFAVL